jgi:prephenate dehydratase
MEAPARVTFAGEHGSFAEDALIAAFGGGVEAAPVPSFRDVFEQVAAGADAGVLPIENLVAGTVREVYDLLLEHDLVITGEVIVPVRLCLAGLPGERLESIERIYSHIQALGQAESFLRTRPWSLLTTYNTAGAGKLIVERQERGAAAVLSPRAAALFGLEVLASDIQDVPDNRTRFLVVRRRDHEPTDPPPRGGPMRTTLVMAVRNEPGELHRCLRVFATAGLNMSKLESRPSRQAPWEYVFWVELDADATDATTMAALDELEEVAPMVRVLGSYARGAEP